LQGAGRVDLARVAARIREAVGGIEVECRRGGPRCSEENVKIAVESILWGEVWSRLGVERPVYEKPLGGGAVARSYKRVDAFYGLTVFEYKSPRVDLAGSAGRDEAVRQVMEYIGLALEDSGLRGLLEGLKRRGYEPLVFGVVTNGRQVVFVEYSVGSDSFRVDPPQGAYPLDEHALRRIVAAVTASWRKRFTAENLAGDFGYRSTLAREAVRRLYEKLSSPRSRETRALFEEWRRTVSIAYPRFGEEVRRVAGLYGFTGEVDGDKLFFAIQTYYSIVLKLLAAEIASRFYDSSVSAYMEYLSSIRESGELRRAFQRIESGELFADLGIRGFAEKDFFSWYLEEWDEEVEELLRSIIGRLSEYDASSVYLSVESARDLLKMLYEELIPRREVRQKLGIYATPDWLAELVVREAGLAERLSEPCNVRVLDPGCGTGTFLSLVIQEVGRRAEPGEATLRCVTRNIVGFDIEPLAVLTAKTNYLVALAATGLLSRRRGDIEIPVYMANSLLPAEYKTATVLGNVRVVRVETSVGELLVPLRLVEEGSIAGFLEDLRDAVELGGDVEALAGRYGLDEGEARVARSLYERLRRLGSTVWVHVLKSHLAPLAFLEYFDYVVGNPPWLAYRFIADPGYQEIVKRMARDEYGLVAEEHLMTHMELATLFFLRTADKYLKDGGVIGFVMPRSVFSADQHDAFRAGRFRGVKLRFKEIIDAEGVKPLFHVPASAFIAEKGGETRYPVEGLRLRGTLPEDRHKVLPLSEAERRLEFERVKFYYNRVGGRSFLDTREVRITTKRSYYYSRFYQGATLVPQPAWLVEVVGAPEPGVVAARSSRRSCARRKVGGCMPPLPVEDEFLYGVLTSAEVLPFTHLQPNTAVLPVKPRSGGYEVLTRVEAARLGYRRLAKWLAEAERLWEESRGGKSGRMTLYERIDYQRLLSTQSPQARYRVVYLRSGGHLAAAVAENRPLQAVHGEVRVVLRGVIVDNTLYRYDTDSREEALYLAAVLNSTVLDGLIKPLQSKGQYGPRDIHKKPLEYPIPRYDPRNELHRRLAELGGKAESRARSALPAVLERLGYNARLRERGFLEPQEVGRLRSAIREEVGDVLEEIDTLTLQLLASPAPPGEGLLRFLNP